LAFWTVSIAKARIVSIDSLRTPASSSPAASASELRDAGVAAIAVDPTTSDAGR
jgi:hypothetical protein